MRNAFLTFYPWLFRIATLLVLFICIGSSQIDGSQGREKSEVVLEKDLSNEQINGVLDRVVDNDLAVILLEAQKTEITVPLDQLPRGSTENTWFHIIRDGNTYEVLSIDRKKTKKEAEKSAEMMRELRRIKWGK